MDPSFRKLMNKKMALSLNVIYSDEEIKKLIWDTLKVDGGNNPTVAPALQPSVD